MVNHSVDTSNGMRVNSVRFNQDSSRFACGLDDGFALFNVNPLKQILRINSGKSIRLVEPLFRCPIVALIGGDDNPAFDQNKVILFDCYVQKTVVELDIKLPIRNVLLRNDLIVVIVESQMLVYTLTDIPSLLLTVETQINLSGICAISHSDSNPILVFPSKTTGHIGLLSLNQRRIRVFKAHNHQLQAITLDLNGSLIASASEKGTLIRVFSTSNLQLLYEFRRGLNNSVISCINFSPDSTSICVSSDNRTTIHVFNLNSNMNQSFIERYFKRDANFIRLYTNHLNESNKNSNIQCAFVGFSIAVIDLNANYYKFDVDIERLSCLKWTHNLFIGDKT